MNRLFIRLFPLIAALAGVARLQADTITLNSGEKLDGKIVGETPTEITIQVKVSAGVLDEKTIEKTEIREMTRETPDDAAYLQIKQLVPGTSSLPNAADYDRILETLNHFVQQFPSSPHNADVTRVIKEFEGEKSRVASGECKYEGKWLSKEEFEKRKPEIMAVQLYDTMKRLAAAGDLVGAMNAMDQIEKTYPGSSVYPEAIELGKRVLPALQVSVARRLQTWNYDLDQWKKGVEITSEPKKSQLIEAFNAEQLRYDSALAATQKAGVKWNPLIPRSEKSLQALLTLIPTEAKRLAAIDLTKPTRSIQLTTKAAQSIAENYLATAEASLNEAKTLWPTNAAVPLLEAQLTALKSKAPSTAEATAAAAGGKQAAKERAAKAAQNAAQAAAEPEPPFYKTPTGALVIVLGVLLLFGGLSVANRVLKPRPAPPKP